MLKIYFACSITGGRDHAHWYADMVEHIAKQKAKVLCEAFADKTIDPAVGLMHKLTAQGVWEADLAWIKESHAVIAEVTQPSFGVGYEIAKAYEWDKPVLALYYPQPGRKLSPMISGGPNVTVVEYSELDHATAAITDFLKQLSESFATA